MQVTVLSDAAVSPNLAAGDAGSACAFVQTTQRESGDIFCLYRRGAQKHGPDGALVAQRSGDGGQTWDAPLTVFDRTDRTPPETIICGGLCAVGDDLLAAFCSVEMLRPEAYVFSDEAEEFPRHINVSRSEDGGLTWTDPTHVDTAPFRRRTGVASSPFLMDNGDVCMPLEVRLDAGPQATAACFSIDGGRTFSGPSLLVGDATGNLSLCDARFARLADGTRLMHLWTFRADTEETVRVRECRSSDGRAWSQPEPVDIQGQISQPLELPSGLVISVCNHRQSPEGSQLWWSRDAGSTWRDRPIQMWDVRESRVTAQPADERATTKTEDVWDELPSFSFGTPALTLLDDGTVLLTYYGTIDGIIHVRACRFRVAPSS